MKSISSVLVCLWLWMSLDSVAGRKRPVDQVIGGKEVRPGEYPFMAYVNILKRGTIYNCGGAVIDKRHILTATHCIIDGGMSELKKLAKAEDIYVKLGCHDSHDCDIKAPHKFGYHVERVMAHYSFGPELANDITLLRTMRDIKFNNLTGYLAVRPVELAKSDETCCDSKQEILRIVGWGQTSRGVHSYQLRRADLETLAYETCKKNYPHINRNVLCAGNTTQSPCLGDSGGPLLRKLGKGKYLQVAVFSFIEDLNCVHEKGAGFTKVAPFYEWIKNCTTGGECKTL